MEYPLSPSKDPTDSIFCFPFGKLGDPVFDLLVSVTLVKMITTAALIPFSTLYRAIAWFVLCLLFFGGHLGHSARIAVISPPFFLLVLFHGLS